MERPCYPAVMHVKMFLRQGKKKYILYYEFLEGENACPFMSIQRHAILVWKRF